MAVDVSDDELRARMRDLVTVSFVIFPCTTLVHHLDWTSVVVVQPLGVDRFAWSHLQLLERLERRVRALDLPSRQLVLLALEGCSTAEIADVTGLSTTNVTTKLSRLRRTLAHDAQKGDGHA